MRNKVHGWAIIRSVEALRRWEKKWSITYKAGENYTFPILVSDAIASDENGKTDVLELHELVDMAKALVHEQDMAALAKTKPELFKQIRNIIYKGADPNCSQCKGTGRYQMPPAFPRFHSADSWANCPCATALPSKIDTTILPVCIEDRAIHILKTKGDLRAGDLGWELWSETTESAKRGTGSHRANKFCRPAGKLLKKLEAANRVTHFAKPGGIFWRAL